MATVDTTHLTEVAEAAAHSGPHIPGIVGEEIFSIGGIGITTTVFSTWLFMIVLFVIIGVFYSAIKTSKNSQIKTFGLDIVNRLDTFFTDIVGNKKAMRVYFPMLGGFFAFIFIANIFGLILDWLGLVSPVLHSYLRPFNSDMSTTLALAVTVIVVSHIAGMAHKGFAGHWKHYLFNFSGNSIIEKIINVPVGWIHFLGEFSRILSLSVRLFANIFAGVALIMVMKYVGDMIPVIGGLAVLPIWFFEIMVAFLQAFIFSLLAAIYIKEAVTVEHH